MKTLLTVRSIEQAIRILGNPKERNITEINSGGYKKSTELVYDGLRISYLETAANGIQLEVVEVTSDNHFLGIGGKKVHPGMPNNKLDQPLRKELNRSKAKRPDDDPHATIFIERKNGTKNKRGETILEHTEIRIEQYSGSSEVKSVTFSRII